MEGLIVWQATIGQGPMVIHPVHKMQQYRLHTVPLPENMTLPSLIIQDVRRQHPRGFLSIHPISQPQRRTTARFVMEEP